MGDQNPWIVENIEAFSFYCCPECDFKSKNQDYFKRHAMESHNKSKVFFIVTKPENTANKDPLKVGTDYGSQNENEEAMEDFDAIENSVKEESISESEGEVFVKLSEHKAQKLITQEDFETFDENERIDIIKDQLKTFDDEELEDNDRGFETLYKESYKNVYECRLCNAQFRSSSHLQRHKANVHQLLKPFTCTYCTKTFGQKEALKEHIKSVHEGKKPYKCSICDFKCSRKANLKEHIESVHEEKKPYQCQTCFKHFASKGNLVKHMTTAHSEDRPYKCRACPSSFKQAKGMKRHGKTCAKLANPEEAEPSGSETFDGKDLEMETFEERDFEKTKGFNEENIDDFIEFEKSEEGQEQELSIFNKLKSDGEIEEFNHFIDNYNGNEDKNNKIDISKNRKRKLDAERELKVISHKKSKPKQSHECPICQKAMAKQSWLKQHIKTVHEKKKDHKCEMCPRDFARKNALAVHIKTVHFFDRDFACNRCDLKFSRRENLNVHINEVHENIIYKCDFCGSTFKRPGRLQKHIKDFHQDKI